MTGPSFWLAVLVALARHPSLWTTAVVQAVRLTPARWWRRPPFLPVPDADYLRFRMETQYGSDGRPEVADVITYLHWCRAYARR